MALILLQILYGLQNLLNLEKAVPDQKIVLDKLVLFKAINRAFNLTI